MAKEQRVELFAYSFGVKKIFVTEDERARFADGAALGPALSALHQKPDRLFVGIGAFADKGPALRFCVLHNSHKLVKDIGRSVQQIISAFVRHVEWEQKELDPRWLLSVMPDEMLFESDKSGGKKFFGSDKSGSVDYKDKTVMDMTGAVPSMLAANSQANSLWTAQFLDAIGNFAGEDMQAGIVVMLRSLADVGPQEHGRGFLSVLRQHFDDKELAIGHSEQREVSEGSSSSKSWDFRCEKGSMPEAWAKEWQNERKMKYPEDNFKKGEAHAGASEVWASRSTEKHETTTTLPTADFARELGRGIGNELLRTGAWLGRVRAFVSGKWEDDSVEREDESVAKVAALLWSAVTNVSTVNPGSTADLPLEKSFNRVMQSKNTTRKVFDVDVTDSGGYCLASEAQVRFNEHNYYEVVDSLARQGLDLHFNFAEKPNIDKSTVAKFGRLYAPSPTEMLLSGAKLSSLLQLPANPNALVKVVSGFDYCVSPTGRHKGNDNDASFQLGGFALGASDGNSSNVDLRASDVNKHVLVVGATGSGKTTTVIGCLERLCIVAGKKGTPPAVVILEGAKRQYREYSKALNIDVYDLQDSFLELNIFEHPSHVSPEAHISNLTSLFESTLDLPAFLPMLLQEGFYNAYNRYHAHKEVEKTGHPISFWLLREMLNVLGRANYGGEVGQNVTGALRTRLMALSLGTAGKVLAGKEKWETLCKTLSQKSILLEMESIADQRSRALVMSLFVMYFRYAVEETSKESSELNDKRLRNVLVLEEAHKIIGKRDGRQESGASSNEYFSNLLSEIRSYGCGIIISDQSPSRLIDDAMRNTNTKIIMRLVSGQDIETAVIGAGLPENAMKDIPSLECGQAIVLRPDELPTLVNIAPADVKPHTEAPIDLKVARQKTTDARLNLQKELGRVNALFEFLPKAFGARSQVPIGEVNKFEKSYGLKTQTDCTERLKRLDSEVSCECGQRIARIPNTDSIVSVCPHVAEAFVLDVMDNNKN